MINFLLLSIFNSQAITVEDKASLVIFAGQMIEKKKARISFKSHYATGTLATTGEKFTVENITGYKFKANLVIKDRPVEMNFLLGGENIPSRSALLQFFSDCLKFNQGKQDEGYGYPDTWTPGNPDAWKS